MTDELDERITLQVNGEPREILMVYGLINELAHLVDSPENLAMMTVDHDLRDKMLLALLAERSDTGKVLKQSKSVYDYAVSIKEVDRLLTWAMLHVTSFFMQAVQRAHKTLETANDLGIPAPTSS